MFRLLFSMNHCSILILAICLLWSSFPSSASAAKSETLNQARIAAQHGEWEQTAELALKATQENSSDQAAWALLGEAQMTLGDTADAISSYEKAVELDPKLADPVLELTLYYLRQGRMADAERVVAAAEAKDKKGKIDEIRVARGQIFAKQGNMAEATKIIMDATNRNPKNPLYPKILARIYADQNVTDLAADYYAKAWELAPGDPTVAYEYGVILQTQKKYNEALNLFKVVQEKDPKNKTVDYLIGRLYYAAKQYAEAATQFEKAVEKRPDHLLSHYLLGKSYYEFSKAEKKNFYAQAEKSLRKAHELRPERADIRNLLAEVIFTQAKIYFQRAVADTAGNNTKAFCDSAIAFAQEAAALDTGLVGVNSQIARAFNKLGNLDSAIYYHRLQLKRTPDDATEFARLVNALQRKKDQAGLVEALQPAYDELDWTQKRMNGDTSSTPQSAFLEKYAIVFANALVETGKFNPARDALKTMLSYDPAWCDGYGMSANLEFRRENFAGAVPVLLTGVKNCPRSGDLWLSLGDAQYFSDPKNKENVKKAKEYYERACNLGNRDACEKLQQLSGGR